MAGTKISDLGALTTTAVGDLVVIVDVSDNSMGPDGTDKKMTVANLFTNPPISGTVTSLSVTALNVGTGGFSTGSDLEPTSANTKSVGTSLSPFATAFVRDGTITRDASVGRDLSVTRDTKVTQHLLAGGALFTVTLGAGAGSGAAITAHTGTDMWGNVRITPGTGASGVICRVTYAVAFATAPYVVCFAGGGGSGFTAGKPWVSAMNAAYFELSDSSGTIDGVNYHFNFMVGGTF